MVGAISGTYNSVYFPRAISQTRGTSQVAPVWAARRLSNPEAAVEPVNPVRPTPDVARDQGRLFRQELPTLRQGVDPVEWAVRMRIQPAEQGNQAAEIPGMGTQKAAGEAVPGLTNEAAQNIPGLANEAAQNIPGLPGEEEAVTLPGLPGEGATLPSVESDAELGAEGVQKAAEEGRCETCEKRKYQDGSDDPGVSFKTPTNVSPEMAASAVRGHEQEHVVREQAKARREDRKVVSQTVTYHTEICPECGRVYVSGGTTRTVTAADNQPDQQDAKEKDEQENNPFAPAAVA